MIYINQQQLYILRQKQVTMNSPKYKNDKKFKGKLPRKQITQNFQSASDSLQIKPWNSNKLAFISSCIGKKVTGNNIFSLSNRSSNTITKPKEAPLVISQSHGFKGLSIKPQTAPQINIGRKKNFLTKEQQPQLSQQLTKLGQVVTEQVLDGDFQQNLQSINFYPQFRASLQQRKNLMFLKPYIKSHNKDRKKYNMSTFDGLQKLKTELYQGIRESENLYTQKQKQNDNKESLENNNNPPLTAVPNTNRSAIIQYMTQYQGQPMRDYEPNIVTKTTRKSQSCKQKNAPICVLRQKLKNKYRDSNYADKIVMIKRGQGVPITIIQ